MRYIINKIVTFNVAERKLYGSDTEVILSNPACRLLIALLENNQIQVSREELLHKVWDDFGLVSSESSLNNGISSLRRSLSQMGVDNALETIPKKGFMLHIEDLKYEVITPDYLSSSADIPTGTGSSKKMDIRKHLNKKSITIMILIAIGLLFAYIKYPSNASESNYQFYKQINQCNIYYFDGVNERRVQSFFESEKSKEIILGCNIDSDIYYDDNKNELQNKIFERFVSVCSKNSEGEVNECKNFVYGNSY
jgi:DNA-binding winged helix-turn-helix (wHTH) protein